MNIKILVCQIVGPDSRPASRQTREPKSEWSFTNSNDFCRCCWQRLLTHDDVRAAHAAETTCNGGVVTGNVTSRRHDVTSLGCPPAAAAGSGDANSRDELRAALPSYGHFVSTASSTHDHAGKPHSICIRHINTSAWLQQSASRDNCPRTFHVLIKNL